MTDIEYGTFAVDHAARRVRGILVPWGERSRTSASKTKPITFPRGSVRVPRDPAVVSLNIGHDRFTPVGRGALFEDQDAGLYAEFDIANTDEGDAWLADRGEFVKLSAEVKNITRDETDHGTADLTGAALVTEGAFASAALFAIDDDGDETTDDESEPTEPAPADEDTETDPESEEDKEDAVAEFATVPGSLPQGRTPEKEKKDDGRALFARRVESIRRIGAGVGSTADFAAAREYFEEQQSSLFALNDVDYDGTNGVGAKMTPPQWLGENRPPDYIERFAPLFRQDTLTSLALGGFKWGTKPTGGTWTGNKDAIPSNTPTIVPETESASRWAGGHDIAREHKDFGTPGFFESYEYWMRRSFLEWLDKTIVLTEALAGATDIEADNPAGLDIGAALSATIDGAAAVINAGYTPTFAVMDTNYWKTIAKIPHSAVLGYLNAQISLRVDGDGNSLDSFRIVPAPVGTITASHVLVGARDAATVFKLPGSPIRAEALNIANGGLDYGFFGYGGLKIEDATALVDVAPYTP